MFDQLDDGSHEITLRNIRCPGCHEFPTTSGVLKWNRSTGITFSLKFDGIWEVNRSRYYARSRVPTTGVGRLTAVDVTLPNWVALTDDGTDVSLFGVIETPTSHRGVDGTWSSFDGTAVFAVVDVPTKRMLAFDNSTDEHYRMFFVGAAGMRFHNSEEVVFQEEDTSHAIWRSSTTLSTTPRISLLGTNALVKCKPSGWLAFDEAPTNSDCEIAAFAEQNFVSFLNGEKVPFHWADRRISSEVIRRTYFGWVKCNHKDRDEVDHQPLPLMSGTAVFDCGEEVLSHLPRMFENFCRLSHEFDFGIVLHPLWTAFDSVLQDRLALASVSLERLVSVWNRCRAGILTGRPASDASVWKKKQLLKSLRNALQDRLKLWCSVEARKQRCHLRVTNELIACVRSFIGTGACSGLTDLEKRELLAVLSARINDWTKIPNAAQLRQPFEDLNIALSAEEHDALKQRNAALHGGQIEDSNELDTINLSAEYFDRLRTLITKFVLALCDYQGPYVDYASRPPNGNFAIRKMDSTRRAAL